MGPSLVLGLLGTILIAIVMTDVIWTTITTKGSGPLSRPVTHVLKCFFLMLSRRSGDRRVLVLAGPVALIALGLLWLMGLWLGWLSLLLGVGGVVEATTGSPASLSQYLYYTGMTLSTLGIGDFKAGTDSARLLTTLAAFNGLVLVTLIITYAIPMVGAVTARRKVAYSLYILGGDSRRLRERFEEQEALEQWVELLRNSTVDLLECAEQRFAYPLLDCFYSAEKACSLGLQLAILDEALRTLSSSESAKESQLIRFQLFYFRNGLLRYVGSRVGRAEEELSEPEGREALRKMVAEEGWAWEEVEPPA